MRAGTLETIHLIMANSSILAWIIWLAIINIIFTVGALEPRETSTRICAYVVITACTIHAWLGITLSELMLAVRSSVADGTLTAVGVADIPTFTVVETEV